MFVSIYRYNIEGIDAAAKGFGKGVVEDAIKNAQAMTHSSGGHAPKSSGSGWKWAAGIGGGLALAGGAYYAGHKGLHKKLFNNDEQEQLPPPDYY